MAQGPGTGDSGSEQLFGPIPDSLPESMDPSDVGVLDALVNLFMGIVTGIVAAFGIGLTSIPLAVGETLNSGFMAVATWTGDLADAIFGPIAAHDWGNQGLALLESLGPFGFLLAVLVVGATMYVFAEVLPGDG